MFKKLNKKGFTLAELLIVVAIIGVLVAISIPIFTTQLEKSRDAVTLANLRSAYAEAQASYLVNSDTKSTDPIVEHQGKQTVTFTQGTNPTVAVSNVTSKGQQDGLSGLTELPFDASGLEAKASMGGTPKDWTVTFKYTTGTDGKLTITATATATATAG
jgi:prepilin-type N-terminal cleavage/methylation domain-containing protein